MNKNKAVEVNADQEDGAKVVEEAVRHRIDKAREARKAEG